MFFFHYYLVGLQYYCTFSCWSKKILIPMWGTIQTWILSINKVFVFRIIPPSVLMFQSLNHNDQLWNKHNCLFFSFFLRGELEQVLIFAKRFQPRHPLHRRVSPEPSGQKNMKGLFQSVGGAPRKVAINKKTLLCSGFLSSVDNWRWQCCHSLVSFQEITC